MSSEYTADTEQHIGKVRKRLVDFANELDARALAHDASKLEEPELSMFPEVREKLDALEYGSAQYDEAMKGLQPALDHHFAHNSHHPEHFENGVAGMNLIDVVEMVCDWKAASERPGKGDLRDGLTYNFERYGIEPQMQAIIRQTVDALWPEEVSA